MKNKIQTVSQSTQQNDSLRIFADSLTLGATYYICVKQDTSLNYFFRLCVDKLLHKEWFANECEPPQVCLGTFDLISNGTFVPNTINYNTIDPFLTQSIGQICGWQTAWGTPSLYKLAEKPGFPVLPANNWAAYLWSRQGYNTKGEGIYHDFNFGVPQQNENYSLSFKYATNTTLDLNVVLTNDVFPFLPSSVFLHDFVAGIGSDMYLIQNEQINNTNLNWERKTVCLNNITDNYARICIYPRNIIDNVCRAVAIDDVSIIKHSFHIINEPLTLCSLQSVNITTAPCPNVGNEQGITWDFIWSTGETTQNITVNPTTTTTYSVTATNSCGYSYTDDITITVSSLVAPIIVGNNNNCDSKASYQINNANPNYTYFWRISDDSYSSSFPQYGSSIVVTWQPLFVNADAEYTWIIVEATDNSTGCNSKDSIKIWKCCRKNAQSPAYNDTIINDASIFYTVPPPVFNGNITINGYVTVSNLSSILMAPEARIIVNPPYTFTVNTSTISAGCNFMWDGIYIPGSTACTLTSSTIMDAKCALESESGSVFNISGSTFDKNYVDIYVGPYANPHTGTVKRTKFICTAALKPQYPPVSATQTKVGIWIVQVPNITIGSYTSLADSNYFSQMDIGMTVANSTLYTYNNSFKNIIQGTDPNQITGYGIYSYYLPQYAKYATTYLYAGDNNIGGVYKANRFRNCTNGIYSYNTEGFVIKNNTFNNNGLSTNQKGTAICMDEPWHASGTTKQINSNTISNIHVGINLNHVNLATIQYNTISNLVYYPQALVLSSGINMDGCTSNSVTCNSISNTSVTSTYGIKGSISIGTVTTNTITRMQHGIFYSGTSSPTSLVGNKLYYNSYGVHLDNGGIIGYQGTSSYANANTWTGSTAYDLYTSNSTDGTLSRYYYKGSPQPTSGSSGSIPIPIYSAANNSMLMACTSLQSFLNEPVTSADQDEMENIVNDEINYTNYQAESREISKQHVYTELLNTDTTNTSVRLKTFVHEQTAGDLGKIETVAQHIFTGDLQQAKAANDAISENEKTVKAIKEINTILLNASTENAGHYYKFTENELLVLQNMAGNCPYEYGNAVYMARGALRSVDTTVYQNACEIIKPAINAKNLNSADNENNPDMNIYPNPANTELHIDCIQTIEMQVEIYDYTGKFVFGESMNALENTINIDKFTTGIYTLRILNNNLQIRIEKITVIK